MFPHNDMLGIDYIIPDYEYLRQKADKVVGIVITHGHEDHIGAIHHVLNDIPAPVYATRLTRGLIEVKLARNSGNQQSRCSTRWRQATRWTSVHSKWSSSTSAIPSPIRSGLGITTPAGLVVHMSDFKFDHTPVDGWPTDYAKLAEFSRRGVDLLLSDSTNAERPGWTPSEMVIGPAFDKVFTEAPGACHRGNLCLVDLAHPAGGGCRREARTQDGAGRLQHDRQRQDRPQAWLSGYPRRSPGPARPGAADAGPQGGLDVHRLAGRTFVHRGTPIGRDKSSVRSEAKRHGGPVFSSDPGQRRDHQQDDQSPAAPRRKRDLRLRWRRCTFPVTPARKSRSC